MRTFLTITAFVAAAALLPISAASAAGSEVRLLDARIDLDDRPSLQRGAKLFVNYCLSCHSAAFMRYNRMARDIGISDEQLKENLLFAGDKVGDTMTVAIREEDAIRWFNTSPPDLSVVARSRGADWLYTYLLTFYRDDNPARRFGVNNLVFKDVAMPHVLAGLQGEQVLKPPVEGGAEREGPVRVNDLLELRTQGTMNPGEYRRSMRDLVNFLEYLGEPAKLDRYRVGFWVLVFLAVFYLLARSLYKEYWKDVY